MAGRRSVLRQPQSAAIGLTIGKRGRFDARVKVTPAGLLSIGALVTSILLSSAVIVVAAGRARRTDRDGPDPQTSVPTDRTGCTSA